MDMSPSRVPGESIVQSTPSLPAQRLLTAALTFAAICAVHASIARSAEPEPVWLSALDLSKVQQGWGKPQADKSVQGKPLSIGGRKFERGVGTHAASSLCVDLGRRAAIPGLGGRGRRGRRQAGQRRLPHRRRRPHSVEERRDEVRPGGQKVDLDLKGVKTLVLLVGDAGDGINFDHADWADARFIVHRREAASRSPRRGKKPSFSRPSRGPSRGSTARRSTAAGRAIRSSTAFPTTGERPMAFAADGLPDGLTLDAADGHHHRRRSAGAASTRSTLSRRKRRRARPSGRSRSSAATRWP